MTQATFGTPMLVSKRCRSLTDYGSLSDLAIEYPRGTIEHGIAARLFDAGWKRVAVGPVG